METPEERVLEMERELVKLREALNRSRMDKELLEWEKSQAGTSTVERQDASNPQAEFNAQETPIRAPENPQKFQEVDSEIRFKLPQPAQACNEMGYMSMDPMTQASQNPTFPTSPQPGMMYGMSTPIAPKIVLNSKQTTMDASHVPTRNSVSPNQLGRQSGQSPAPGYGHAPDAGETGVPMQNMQHRGVHQRPLLVPDRYNGETSWSDYEQHFKACMEVNGWDDRQAAIFLSASLQGKALRVVSNVGPRTKDSYQELRRLLSQRFGPSNQAENYLAELRHRRQGPRETLQELGQAIHELSSKAYPDIPPISRDRLERNHFIDAIESQSIREGIHRARPSSLDDAIRAALETDNFEKIELQRRNERMYSRPTKFTRALDHEDEIRIQGIERLIEQQTRQMETLTNAFLQENRKQNANKEKAATSSTSSSNRAWQEKAAKKCFRCGDPNHFIRQCPVPKRNAQPMGNASQPTEGPTERL